MSQGIQLDESGNMSAVNIPSDYTEGTIRELVGAAEVSPIRLDDDLTLWVDARPPAPHDSANRALTALAATYGYDAQVYGVGVFIGSAPNAPLESITETVRLELVFRHIRNETALLSK